MTEHTANVGLVAFQSRIYREGRAGLPVDRLFPLLVDPVNMHGAWERVRSADGAETPGPDGVTASQIQDHAAAWLNRLAADLTAGTYRPAQPRLVQIPKPNKPGQLRTLGILNIRDRVVQAALKQVLEPLIDPTFRQTSFGFRPGRSVPGALAAVLAALERRPGSSQRASEHFAFALHLDVESCFDTIDHAALREELRRYVCDPAVLQLLDRLLEAGGRVTGHWFWRRTVGLVQGGCLSPLLCNLALHPSDLALADLAVVRRGRAVALRYADDLLVLGWRPGDVRTTRDALRHTLAERGQRLGTPHARPLPLAEGINWLGVRIQPRAASPGQPLSFGYIVPAAKRAACLVKLDELTTPPNHRVDPRSLPSRPLAAHAQRATARLA